MEIGKPPRFSATVCSQEIPGIMAVEERKENCTPLPLCLLGGLLALGISSLLGVPDMQPPRLKERCPWTHGVAGVMVGS